MYRMLRSGALLGLILLSCLAQSHDNQSSPSRPSTPAGSPLISQQQGASGNETSITPATPSANMVSPPITSPLGEAIALYRKGDFDGALAKYKAILQTKPKSPDAYAGMVRVYLKQKNVEQAAQTAAEALSVSDAARIRVARAEVLFRQGRIEDAEREWVNVINSGYPEARAYLGLARVRRALAMYKTAQTFIKKAHDLDPDDPDIAERWVSTLPPSERIKYLEDALAGENNWDEDRRFTTTHYLEYLKERANRKVSPCRLASKLTSTETPLIRLLRDPTHLRGYGLPVVLNGHKSSLMLDTGASGIVVKRAIAEKAGISKITATKIGGVGDKGWKDAYVGIADSIKVGDLEFVNCPIEVMEGRSVADEDGLISVNVFDDFLIDINFPDEKLKLSELPKRPGQEEQKLALKNEEYDEDSDNEESSHEANASSADSASHRPSGPQDRYIAPEMQGYTRVFLFGHHLLVSTKIGDIPPKLFLLDTGALTNFISPAAAREVTKVGAEPDILVRGLNGAVNKVYTANKAILQFGHLKQENQEMVAFDTTKLSDNAGAEISGFLGFAMLRFLDIKIDYRDALVDFSYDPKRWHY